MTQNNSDDVELLRKLAPALALYARQWCDCAEDVVQNAFVKLFRQTTRPDNVAAWLYRVVRNEAINTGRAQHRRTSHEQNAASTYENYFNPTASVDKALDSQVISQRLAELPEDQRSIVVMRIWGELSFDQIGRILKCSASTAARRYRTGLESIRQCLGNSNEP